jgi:hypothetical protein
MDGDEASVVPPRPQVTLLRFSLRRLFVYVGVLCVLFAILAATDGLLLVAVLLVILVVGAHVMSTFVGTRLRDGSTTTTQWEAAYGIRPNEPNLAIDQPRGVRDGLRGRAAQQLQGRGPVVRRLWLFVAAGSLAGAGGGLGLVIATFWPRIGLAAMLAGSLAAAILGGWIAFLGCSFFGITRRAWREALDDPSHRATSKRQDALGKTARGRWRILRR